MIDSILERAQEAASKRLLFLPHTIRQMARPDRMIATTEVETVVMTGEVTIITAYLPDPNQWTPDFRGRL